MCTTRILASSKVGFINQCTDCESIRIAFGTTLMNLRVDEFKDICSQIYEDVQLINDQMNPNSKSIQISHPLHPEFSFVLSINELNQLNDLVQSANILLSAYNLLKDENE
jgi:hypothetical protein